jgi:tRNA dimethylallyltransferase
VNRARKITVLILFGPTASGKTDFLQQQFCREGEITAEVISADSMQVYQGMDIGTAKPSPELQAKLPHHLIDIRKPSEQFNAGDFVRLADEAAADIHSRGRLPVVAGGTAFYLSNFIYGMSEAPPSNRQVQEALREELAEKGPVLMLEELRQGDPVSAERIKANDTYRLLRAIEVLRSSGRPLSSYHWFGEAGAGLKMREQYDFDIQTIERPRDEVYRRINERCRQMFQAGLEAEVNELFEKGYTPDDPGMKAIGYREFFEKVDGQWTMRKDIDAVEALIAQHSRQYAKRQIVWFNRFNREPRDACMR